ncbi:hypothetical protein G7Y89_g4900 [Cudoniella acicularis]|uniref:Uncharacterized protein n=1 Tax=Cudoniella acicularis TaxID=354080 RepID=A0A8H4W683_9HELO|nr:hypothetical protein G7Y89_g4900 [Cudoniella acicularis]
MLGVALRVPGSYCETYLFTTYTYKDNIPEWLTIARTDDYYNYLDMLEDLKNSSKVEHNITITSATLSLPTWTIGNSRVRDLFDEACLLAGIEIFAELHDSVTEFARLGALKPEQKSLLILDHSNYHLDLCLLTRHWLVLQAGPSFPRDLPIANRSIPLSNTLLPQYNVTGQQLINARLEYIQDVMNSIADFLWDWDMIPHYFNKLNKTFYVELRKSSSPVHHVDSFAVLDSWGTEELYLVKAAKLAIGSNGSLTYEENEDRCPVLTVQTATGTPLRARE